MCLPSNLGLISILMQHKEILVHISPSAALLHQMTGNWTRPKNSVRASAERDWPRPEHTRRNTHTPQPHDPCGLQTVLTTADL